MRAALIVSAIALSTTAFDSSAYAQIPTDAVAWWALDDGAGTTAADSAGSNDGELMNAPAWTVGHSGGALQFNGSNYVRIVSPAVALKPAAGYAISAWVKFTSTGTSGGEIASMGDSYALRVLPAGGVRTYFYDGSTWRTLSVTTVATNDNAWHHLVGQYTGSELHVYVDGVKKGTATVSGAIAYTLGSAFHLARHANGSSSHNFFGTLDQVRVFARPLSDAEVAALAAESPSETSDAWWKLDDGAGITAADSSGANDGSLASTPTWTAGGRVNGALTFDGTDHVVVTAPDAALRPTAAYAISAWVRYTTAGSSGSEVASMGDSYALRVLPDGNVRTWFYDGTTWKTLSTSGVNTKDGLWHHLVGQYDGGQLKLFVDGVEKGALTAAGTIAYTLGGSFYLGRHGTSAARYFTGTLDEVRVFGRALQPGEISALAGEIGPNQAPVITSTTVTPTSGVAPHDVTFSVAASDPENGTLTYRWDLNGDGSIDRTTASGAYTYALAGHFTPRVTVSDDVGNWAVGTTSSTVDVTAGTGGPSTFKVMTWNIFKGRFDDRTTCNLEFLAQHVVDKGVSVLATQETMGSGYCYGTGMTASSQSEALEKWLEAKSGAAWSRYAPSGQGAAIYWRQDLPDYVPDAQNPWPTDYKEYSEAASYGGRVLKVSLQIDGRWVSFFSTHLSYYCPDGVTSTTCADGRTMSQIRNAQVTEFKPWVAATTPYRIWMGDMNHHVTPGSTGPAEYQNLTNGYADVWKFAFDHGTDVHADGEGIHTTRSSGSSRFDYAFMNDTTTLTIDGAEVTRPRHPTTNKQLSDHLPVITTITVN
jgi:endonuclease/exonuclease/phosphatase family metal-dependent hydrolase